jgi:outer membrane cobalamin receptor
MWKFAVLLLAAAAFASAPLARATIFGNVRGIVHDPQHRPIPGAEVQLKAASSDWSQTTQTNPDGEFTFAAVPLGDYIITTMASGFEKSAQSITVFSDSSPILHFMLAIAGISQTATVSAQAETANVESVTPATLVNRQDIVRTPGADRTNSLSIITDFVPGAYYAHDQLHIRGGHQVSWLIDGVPVPNTNIASNVGPQFDPKDIDYLEVERGSYDAEYGDRTYAVFNVVPRTGFERNNEGDLVTSFGNFYQTNDQVSLGSHTERLAYYASVNGNRSNLGLETPVGRILHDAENGFGGFGSLIFNADPKNQLRFVASARRDFYQIPNTPEQQAICSPTPPEGSICEIRDAQREADAFVTFSWVRTINPNMVLTVSPFYHYNSANYDGGPNDFPISTTDDRASSYAGVQSIFSASVAKNNLQAGVYGFGQHDSQTFGLVFNDQSHAPFSDREPASGGLVSVFLADKFRPVSWLTLIAGVRQTHFSGTITEDASSPRFGATIQLPRLHWVFRAFYGRYYQAPPLLTASGPLLKLVTSQNLGFIPLHGERDEEHQFGVTIPVRGWSLDAGTFQTRANNYFDHNNLGNSDIFFPLTIGGALIQGWELTLRSPRLWQRGQVHLAYSNQIAKARGAITGGLTDFSPPQGYFPLDHDQRNTLDVGFDANLGWKSFVAANVSYGSGFVNGEYNPPVAPNLYLPGHTTFDLSLGKEFGERFSVSVSALNVANRHLLIDNSLTFGGTHYNNPREIYAEFRYRFHY